MDDGPTTPLRLGENGESTGIHPTRDLICAELKVECCVGPTACCLLGAFDMIVGRFAVGIFPRRYVYDLMADEIDQPDCRRRTPFALVRSKIVEPPSAPCLNDKARQMRKQDIHTLTQRRQYHGCVACPNIVVHNSVTSTTSISVIGRRFAMG